MPDSARARLPLITAGLAYAALVLFCAFRHEPWLDEAQAWLVARDSGLRFLLFHQMRYDGTPALWYLVLRLFIQIGLPYAGLNLLSASFGILGVALFLRYAPFPLALRILFPFTYVPLFQYSVIARSYVLLLPLLMLMAILYPHRYDSRRWAWYLLTVAVLANVSAHGAIFAAVLFLEWILHGYRRGFAKTYPRAFSVAVIGVASLYILLFLQLRPPPDLNYNPMMHPTLQFAISRASTQVSEALFGGLGSQVFFRISFLASVAVFLASAWWMRQSSIFLILLAGWMALVIFAGWKYGNYWHSGVLFLVWIFALWVAINENPAGFAHAKWIQGMIAFVFLVQISYGIRSVVHDIRWPYSGSKAAAAYLKSHNEDHGRIYAWGFKAFGVQPYFDHNLFQEQEHGRREAFYAWSSELDHTGMPDVDREHPERVIVPVGYPDQYDHPARLHAHGYCEEARFPGAVWWKNGISEPDIYVVMSPCAKGAAR